MKFFKSKRLIKGICFVTGGFFIILTLSYSNLRIDFIKRNEISKNTIIAPFDFSYKKLKRITKEDIEKSVKPIYKLDLTELDKQIEKIERFFEKVRNLRDKRIPHRRIKAVLSRSYPEIPEHYLDFLIRCDKLYSLSEDVKKTAEYWLKRGVTDIQPSVLKEHTKRGIELLIYLPSGECVKKIIKEKEAEGFICLKENQIREIPQEFLSPYKEEAIGLARLLINENLRYLPQETQERIKEFQANQEFVIKRVKKGEVLVKEGQMIDKDKYTKLLVLQQILHKNKIKDVLEKFLLLSVFFLFFFIALRIIDKKVFEAKYLGLIFFIFFFIFGFAKIIQIQNLSFLILPLCMVGMILFSVFGKFEIVLLSILFCAVVLSYSCGINLKDLLILLSGSFFSVYLMKYTKIRGDIIKVVGGTCLVYGFLISIDELIKGPSKDFLFKELFLCCGINGLISAILSLILIKYIVEKLFSITTNYRLFELTDLNSPLLKNLLLHAPGSYHHSLIVAALSEESAAVCGANPVLAKVASYYHDIGKVYTSMYFPENKFFKDDILPPIKPTTYISLQQAHIRDGVALAKMHNLPQEVIQIIKEHHAKDFINLKGEINFPKVRYDGQLPSSKESAIVMLADKVEMEVRETKNITQQKLEEIVKNVIEEKFKEGDLANSLLTFKDLANIQKTFISLLKKIISDRLRLPNQQEDIYLSKIVKNA